jgi:phosphatidylserine/phosphatidylglycerophosphate/cardiolipin synthase-like enzyme
VFISDSQWLKKNAAGSARGSGAFWRPAIHLDAPELLGDGFRARVAKSVSEVRGWDTSQASKAVLLTEKDFYAAFTADLMGATERVILYTPFIGKTRWPQIEPFVTLLRDRSVEVYLLHKPLSDRDWRKGDAEFGKAVFQALENAGVHLVPMSGVHAKTIVIDSQIVYEGSLNWASQVASYEHMWRFDSKDMALLIERMLQLDPIVDAFGGEDGSAECPNCRPLVVVNQREKQNQASAAQTAAVKLGCLNHEEN